MSTMLWEEVAVPAAAGDEDQSIPVDVTLLLVDGKITFQQELKSTYSVEEELISLVGSGGTPREFVLSFRLSADMVALGYTFDDPAAKFFQGGSRKAGFRYSPEPSGVEVQARLFNTMDDKDSPVADTFNLLLIDPQGGPVIHDPAIAWDPPIGGVV